MYNLTMNVFVQFSASKTACFVVPCITDVASFPAGDVCSLRQGDVESELDLVATGVSTQHSGRSRKDRGRYEFCGMNLKTKAKYLHVLHMWADYCIVARMFTLRWSLVSLTEAMWMSVAWHFYTYSGRAVGLSASTLESYMRMLSHALVYMAALHPIQAHSLHLQQQAVIQRVVEQFCVMFPVCRSKRNTKLAWDDTLVDAALQLLLMWNIYGHCYLKHAAWPAFARMTLSMLNYLGWRPFSLTRDRVDAKHPRWFDKPILAFGDCQLGWGANGRLLYAQVFGKRTKFNSSPMFEVDETGNTKDRYIMDGKLTYSDSVDTCPALAWLVWAIVSGAFGFAPLVRVGPYVYMGAAANLKSHLHMTCDDVDLLVHSIFTLMPSMVPLETQGMAVFNGLLLGGVEQKLTDYISHVVHVVGVRLGLNPRKCSAVCGRKTFATATVMHHQTTELDCMSAFQHLCPAKTTVGCYTDASRRNADSRAIMTGCDVRAMPGSVKLAHSRNPQPNMQAAHEAGVRARDVVGKGFGAAKQRVAAHIRTNAYRSAHRAEMQRQFDMQQSLPKSGCTDEQLQSFFFKPLDCSKMEQMYFVAWQVKKAWGLLK